MAGTSYAGNIYTQPASAFKGANSGSPVIAPAKQSNNLAVNNTARSSGGSSSPAPSGGGNNNAPQQSIPGAPDTSEIDKAYSDAMSGIDSLIGSYTNALPGQLAAFDTQANADKTTNANQLSDINANYDTQATKNTSDTNTTNDQQRNAVNEVEQGLQARYGGTTGTGAFASELAYRTGLQNIASNQAALKTVLAGIDQGKSQAQRDFVAQNAKIDANTATLKQQAQDALNQQLAQLQSSKGQLGISRATSKAQIMQNYQDTVNQINSSNVAIKNQWASAQQQFEQQLQLKAQSVQDAALNHNNLTASQLISLVNSGTLSPQGLQDAGQALNLGGGSLQLPPTKSTVTDPFGNPAPAPTQ